MEKNKLLEQTDTGAVDINDIHKRKMIKAFTKANSQTCPMALASQ
jgi:hypothetical protein